MTRSFKFSAAAIGFVLGLILAPLGVLAQPTPIAQAIALLTSGTTPFSIVGINAGGYINWGTGRSSTGYGLRDLAGTIQVKDSGGSWANVTSGGGAPSTATYITQTPAAGLSAEQALSALPSALLRNTTGTGVVSAYTGTSCTNQLLRALSALGAGTCVDLDLSTLGITGTLTIPNGGTGLSATAQGDILYASGVNTLARLAKSGSASRYLSNTGGSNNPAWAQINLANGVTGTLGVSNGGTGITAGTDGGVLGFTATGAIASSALLDENELVLGGGAGDTPSTLGSLGTATTVLHGNAAGAPSFSAVNLATDVTGSIGVAQGGTGQSSYTIGDLLYASGTTALSKLAAVSAGSFLRSAGTTTAPAWSTTKWPNSATTGDLLFASGANQYANLPAVAAGSFLRAAGTTTAPVWSTTTVPNSATTGDILYASASNTYANLAAVAAGRVLSSAGTGTAPVWLTNPSSASYTVTSYVKTTVILFAALPGSPEAGMMASISDGDTATWGATVAGGGANHVLIRHNGTNWTVVGK